MVDDTDQFKKKRYVFEHSERHYADFKIRLKYDNLKQGEFFSLIVEGYINKDPRLIGVVEDYKKANQKMGIKFLKATAQALSLIHI